MLKLRWATTLNLVQAFLVAKVGGLRASSTIGAYIITKTVLGLPYYNYSTMGPKTIF